MAMLYATLAGSDAGTDDAYTDDADLGGSG